MSFKARLKRAEKKAPEEIKAAPDPIGKDQLLFNDYEEYRETYIGFLMAQYMEDYEKAGEWVKKIDYLYNTLDPITKESEFDKKAQSSLMVKKIVDWMEENGLEEINEDRWEVLQNELKNPLKQNGEGPSIQSQGAERG